MKEKLNEKIVDKYVNGGKSILTIAKELGIPYWEIYNLLKFNNIKIRGGRWQSLEGRVKNSKLHTKWFKKDFSGDANEKAYLLGFLMGDLHARKYRFKIRVNCGSTHPSQIKLFNDCFGRYSKIYNYASISNNSGYENSKYYWSLTVDLNETFSFLLNKDIIIENLDRFNEVEFLNYIAGFFDAEGSSGISKGANDTLQFFISMSNKKVEFLEPISHFLDKLNIKNHINFDSIRKMYMIKIRSKEHVFRFIDTFQSLIKHNEKQRKFSLLKKFETARKFSDINERWNDLIYQINEEVKSCFKTAKGSYLALNS